LIRLTGEPPSSFLKVGDLVSGKITQNQESHEAKISIRGRSFMAEVPPNIQTGKELTLEVRSVEPKLVLALVNSGAEVNLTTRAVKIAALADEMTSLIEKLLPAVKGQAALGPSTARGLLPVLFSMFYTGGGPGSLKKMLAMYRDAEHGRNIRSAIVSSVEEAVKSGESGSSREISAAFDEFINCIDSLGTASKDGLYPIPFILDGEMGVASFSRQGGGDEGEDREGARVFTLTVEMSALGTVETSLRVDGKGLMIAFTVESEELASLLRDAMPGLSKSLEMEGVSLYGTGVFSRELTTGSSMLHMDKVDLLV